ncbi:MAG: hypothetical protein PHX36_09805, partial [Mesotoga sp.]|uniref:hypothetical protein n=1 Tax=Mesotoga sp. TaxID=2053577 RepID=UPI002602265E
LRSISGRKAGEDHARSQGPLRGERSSNPPFGDRLHDLHSVNKHKYPGAMPTSSGSDAGAYAPGGQKKREKSHEIRREGETVALFFS